MDIQQEISSWKAHELVRSILKEKIMNEALFAQMKKQKQIIDSGGIFTINVELKLFELFVFNSSLGTWMIKHVAQSNNLWRREIFSLFESKFNLWSEDQIKLRLLFDSLPIESEINLSDNNSFGQYISLTGIVTSIADPFIEVSDFLFFSFLVFVFFTFLFEFLLNNSN